MARGFVKNVRFSTDAFDKTTQVANGENLKFELSALNSLYIILKKNLNHAFVARSR